MLLLLPCQVMNYLVMMPNSGLPYEQVLEELKELKQNEAGVSDKVFAYKYVLDPEGTMQKLQEEPS